MTAQMNCERRTAVGRSQNGHSTVPICQSAVRRPRFTAGGFTLIELILSIVIVGFAVVSVVGALSASAARSAETLVRQQASGIANAYLAEVLSMPYSDPQLPDGEASRNLFDDVDDYNGLTDDGARDRTNAALAGLGQYVVSVAATSVTVGPGAVPAWRVDVTVRPPIGAAVVATGFRTNHP